MERYSAEKKEGEGGGGVELTVEVLTLESPNPISNRTCSQARSEAMETGTHQHP